MNRDNINYSNTNYSEAKGLHDYNNCDIIFSNNRKEDYMSFVIMIANNNGIVCASDSRSTLNANTWYPEIENDITKKVFKNKQMIIGTFGPNKIYDANFNCVRPLENAIEEILNIAKNPFEFIKHFKNKLIEDKVYNFLIGFENEIYEIKIHKNDSTIFFKGQDAVAINKGVLPKTIKYPDFSIFDTLDIMKDKAYNCIKEVIEKVENECLLKFVGGDIQIETLKSE